MSKGIQALPSEAGFKVKADAEAVVVDAHDAPAMPALEQQRGSGFPEEAALNATLVPIVEFHPDHHQTFWPLDKIYEGDPELGLALSKLDKGIRPEQARVQGYLEDQELAGARTPEQREARELLNDIERFAKKDESFDPRNLRDLAAKHPRIAAKLASLDRPHSIKKGHADSYKVSQLSVDLQERYIKVDASLRAAQAKLAWRDADVEAGYKALGKAVATLGIGGTAAGIAGLALSLPVVGWIGGGAFIAMLLTAPILDGGTRIQRAIGRGFRKLLHSKRTRALVARYPHLVLGAGKKSSPLAKIKALPAHKASTDTRLPQGGATK